MSTTESFDSLREYIATIDDRGELQRIGGADWDLEIGAITETVAQSENPRALLFDGIDGYPEGFRVASNLYITENLQALGLGIDPGGSPVAKVKRWRKKWDDLSAIEPTAVDDGPIRENVLTGEDVDITTFPAPKWHEHDGGRFIGTGDSVITRDPEIDWQNMAVYRSQVHDEQTLGILIVPTHQAQFEPWWDRGEAAPVVMTLGQEPAIYAASCLPLPKGHSELHYAGGIKGSSIEVIEHEGTGLPVPANAEIAVIGRVPPPEEEKRLEGPFGECGGYYAGGEEEKPVIRIEEIWHRDDPILQGNPTMTGSASEHALGAEIVTAARTWESIEDDIPNIEGIWPIHQQCQKGADFMVISIEQEYAGHPKQAATAVLGSYPNVTANNVVMVVDEDIDPADTDEVLFAMTTRCDPERDIDVVSGIPSDTLDARISPERKEAGDLTTSSMLVDACKPYHWKDEYPLTNTVSAERRNEVNEKWDLDEWS